MLSSVDEDIQKEKLQNQRCKNCGSEMLYDIEAKALKCNHCESIKTIEIQNTNDEIMELNFQKAIKELKVNKIDETSEANEFECKSCGAIIISENKNLSHKCLYCGSSYISTNEKSTYIQPGSIIPFTITEEKAKETINNFYKKKFYTSKKFKNAVSQSVTNGTYISFWTFDTEASVEFSGNRGDYYYVTERRVVDGKVKNVRKRKTRWRYVADRYNEFFDDVIIQGDGNENKYINRLKSSYNLNYLVPYDSKYALGFSLKKYDVELQEGWTKAKNEINSSIDYSVNQRIGGDTRMNVQWKADFDDITFKHIVLPLWICTTTVNNKTYRTFVNGQTGDVEGEYHKSLTKIVFTIIIVISVVLLLLYKYNT